MTTETVERNWGAEEWRAPDVNEGETILFSECGRILGNVDYRSHYFRLVKCEFGGFALLVKHGGGQERLEEYCIRKIVPALACLDSDNRYLTMYAVYQAYQTGHRAGYAKGTALFRDAFAAGRLKKRKIRNSSQTRVWIEDIKP